MWEILTPILISIYLTSIIVYLVEFLSALRNDRIYEVGEGWMAIFQIIGLFLLSLVPILNTFFVYKLIRTYKRKNKKD